MSRLLLVEDDPDIAFGVSRLLESAGHEVDVAGGGNEALQRLSAALYDLVLLDLGLPDVDGFEVLERFVLTDPTLQVLVLTGRDEAQSAVRALRLGANDYLAKPVAAEILFHAVDRAIEQGSLLRRVETLDRTAGGNGDAVGEAPAFLRALDALRAAASSPRTPVLLTGESGTGKELAARLLHGWSERSSAPLITVNAGAFPATMLESELFGHEAGAFTGARGVRRGLFELATGGSLLLDEIGELSRELQPKLLRVLDGHPFRRLGGEREVRCDFRLISATHRDLAAEVAAGRFREDLYHRLRILEVRLPALRERPADIPLLAQHFARRLGTQLGRPDMTLSTEATQVLAAYDWPGNVRELRNIIERALVLTSGSVIGPGDLPSDLRSGPAEVPAQARPAASLQPMSAAASERLEDVLRAHVRAVFERAGRNVSHAAERLGISRATLRRRLGSARPQT